MVVFVNQKAEVIEYGQLAEYSKDHFDYSLTESQSQLVKLREQFEQENQANDSPAHFSFKVHPNGKIVLRVHGHSDGDLVDRSEYEVDGAQIVAKSHTLYFGPITSLPLLPVTWGLAFMFYKAIKMAFRHWQKTRIKMAPNNAEFQLPL